MSTWKKAEQDFVSSFDHFGKRAYVARLPDTAAAKATGGAQAMIGAQPSDFVVTLDGEVFFAEVKSTQDETTFHFKGIRRGQWNASRRITRAGGKYFFYIKSLYLDQWYCVPAQVLHDHPLKSIKWTELEDWKHAL